MITLDPHHKVRYHESDSRKWCNDRSKRSDDPMVVFLDNHGWKQRHNYSSRFITVQTMMPGFSSGRFTCYIRRLGKKYKGHQYRLIVEYTPYCNNDIRFNGYFNTEEELVEILTGINEKLIVR